MHRWICLTLSCAMSAGVALAQPGDAAPAPGLFGKSTPHSQPAATTTTVVSTGTAPVEHAGPAPATLIVKLPASAVLKVDGKKTGSGSSERTFSSAPLPAGQSHEFKLEAELNNKGQKLTVALSVTVNAGEKVEMPLDINAVTGGAGETSAKTK